MKKCSTILTILGTLLLISQLTFAQIVEDQLVTEVTTIGVFDTLETKSGYKINEYYVELTQQQLELIKGKKVSVTGQLIVVEGIDPNEKEIVQGSLQDRFFIIEPKIIFIDD